MFDEKNHDRNDALGQRLQKIGGQMNPSPELKKAAKTGVPLRAGGIRYTAGTHVRKFTKAVLLYAACIALFLGAILMIPRWFGGNEPVGSDPGKTAVSDPTTTVPPTNDENPTEEMRSPETVYNMLFTEKNVTWSMEIHTEDGGSIDGSISWARKNNLLKKSGDVFGEVPTDVYYDGDRYWAYEYDTEKEAWFKYYQKLDVDQIWTEQCKGYLDENNFKDLYYIEMDGYYKATPTGLSHMMGADVSAYYDQIVCDFTLQDGVYTFRFVLDMEEPNISHSVIIRIGFGNAVFKLPEAEIYVCEHEYVDGICTVCGKSEEVAPETEECEHEFVITSPELVNPCTDDNSAIYTCKKCNYSYTETIPAPGHDYQNGTCTRCGSVDLTAIGGDAIMDLIKADGCPEGNLIYGFDTEADADVLAKIDAFIYTDANWLFSIFSPTFYDPTEVSLYGILYNSNSYTPITEKERQDYYELVDMSPELQEIFSPHKLTTAEIETYLMTYLGIPFTEEAKAELIAPHYYEGEPAGSAVYMEEYDAYYKSNTDSATNVPQNLVKAYINEDGYIMVLADPSRYYDHITAIVLIPSEDGYRFVMCVEL